ncbi:hypothetical protein ACHAWF_003536, partial [Thalassiosira exigua]
TLLFAFAFTFSPSIPRLCLLHRAQYHCRLKPNAGDDAAIASLFSDASSLPSNPAPIAPPASSSSRPPRLTAMSPPSSARTTLRLRAASLAAALLLPPLHRSAEAFRSSSPPPVPRGRSAASRDVPALGAAFVDERYPLSSSSPGVSDSRSRSDDDDGAPTPSLDPTPSQRPPRVLPNGGTLTLVGSGPGDPDLLTVAAHRILSDPDNLVIADRLVSEEVLELIRGECRVANKVPGCQHKAQEEIYEWCKEGLRDGRKVVRLKIGERRSSILRTVAMHRESR